MKRKIRIGVPRAFLYYSKYILWKSFFEGIGLKIVLSPYTNSDIVSVGKRLDTYESCLPFEIFLGHIRYLKDRCDYVLVPSVSSYGKGKKTCMRFNELDDVVRSIFPNIQIINYNTYYVNGKFEMFQYIKMGLKLNRNIVRVLYAYLIGKYKEKKHNEAVQNTQVNVLKADKLKVLIVAQPYIIYDNYLGADLINYFKKENIGVLFADRLERKEALAYANEFSKDLDWEYSKAIMGSVFYYKAAIDGIIFLSSSRCAADGLVNELVLREIGKLPKINIALEDGMESVETITKFEKFIEEVKKNGNR